MDTNAYILRCLSNLHVGQGDSNMGVVDKQVQRDPVTKFPTIHSSGLKGSLRHHFEDKWGKKDPRLIKLFGAGTQNGGDKQEFSAGNLFFGSGQLLSLPVRSDLRPYFHVTTPEILDEFQELLKQHGHKEADILATLLSPLISLKGELKKPRVFKEEYKKAVLEEESYEAEFTESIANLETLEEYLGGPFALMQHKDFQDFTTDLPVIARNQLENGESKNLWYEEIVPREARFYVTIKGKLEDLGVFAPVVNDQLIQIGANATIGYGQTLFKILNLH